MTGQTALGGPRRRHRPRERLGVSQGRNHPSPRDVSPFLRRSSCPLGRSRRRSRCGRFSPDAEPAAQAGWNGPAWNSERNSSEHRCAISFVLGGLEVGWPYGRVPGRRARGRERDPPRRSRHRPADRPAGPAPPRMAGPCISPSAPTAGSFATGSIPPALVAGEVRLWDSTTGRLRFPPMLHTN